MIKDSGERTEFSTGAVRDMHEGKGRFDLLPMCVLMRLAKHYIAAIWNLCGLAWTEEKHPELIDIPARMECNNESTHK